MKRLAVALVVAALVFAAPTARADTDPNVPTTPEGWAALGRMIEHDAQVTAWYQAVALRLWVEGVEAGPYRAVWERVAQCESGGNWSMVGPRFSGGPGFANATWVAFGGRDFADNAGHATEDEQVLVAERVRARFGFAPWGCARRLGLR